MGRKAAAVAALVAAVSAGCGTADRASDAVPAGDPRYVFRQVAELRASGVAHVVEPSSLAEALPNRVLVGTTPSGRALRSDWSELVLTGEVTSARPGSAVLYLHPEPTSRGNEEEVRELDFDDPRADGRNVLVTVRPDWSSGDEVGEEVVFRMGVLGDADPDEFMAGLRGLAGRRIVVLLDAREAGRHRGDYSPVMGGALLGWVEQDGTLAFPGLGDDQREFLGDTRTLAALRAEAARPPVKVRLP